MREIQASEAKTHLPRILNEVERGETIIITRHGRPIARIVPETDLRQAEMRKVKDQIAAFRQSMPPLSLEEILSARHEGHKY